MPLLVGRHVNKIDRKGRVSVPKPFRDALQSFGGGFAGVYAYPLFKDAAVEACGEDYMTRVAESVDDLNMFSRDQDELAMALLESAHQLPFDPEGRVVLPQELITCAGIDGEALFVGRGWRFQIWNPETYQASRSAVVERLKAGGPTLKLRPAGRED